MLKKTAVIVSVLFLAGYGPLRAQSDESVYIQMNSSDAVHYIVTDPSGRSTGRDPRGVADPADGFIKEIPDANYAYQSVGHIPSEGEEVQEDVSHEFVYEPSLPEGSGTYTLKLIGVRSAPYELAGGADFHIKNDFWNRSFEVKGVTAPGRVQTYKLHVTDDTSATNVIEKVVTPASAQRDLEVMRELWAGYVDSRGLFDELEARAQRVEAYLEKGDSTLARTRLLAFSAQLDSLKSEVKASGTHKTTQKGYFRLRLFQAMSNNVNVLRNRWNVPLASAPLSGAVTVAAEDVNAAFRGNRLAIAGTDHTVSGDPSGSGDDAHAVWTTTPAARQGLLDAVKRNTRDNLTGTGEDAPDVRAGALGFDAEALAASVESNAGRRLSKKLSGRRQVGTPQQPVVAYAPDGLKMSGQARGAGILLVDGSFDMKGRSQWQGPVIVRSAQTPEVDLGGNARVIGGLVLLNPDGAARLRLKGNAAVRLSRTALQFTTDKVR